MLDIAIVELIVKINDMAGAFPCRGMKGTTFRIMIAEKGGNSSNG